ncbi:MAG: DEAD/DEAH box helicase family protein [Paludibacteraceae bacterium]|nr:DEAD/DEAH box helicase family protein [Paludibacteraceae bacterium]
MKIEKTTTGVIIREATPEVKKKCLQYFSLTNPLREFFIYSGKDPDHTKVPIIGHDHDVIYITSGFLKIKDKTIEKLKVNSEKPIPTPKLITLEMNREPRSQLQRDCIELLTTAKENKITVELKPGTGKTFIACYSAAKLGLKPLIVAPTSLLKNQWIDNIVELGIDKADIATKIWDAPDKKVCVVTISSLEGAVRDDWNGLLKTLDASGFGIKVIDEAHLHLKGMLKFDALCNIKHNWYMSATLGRSSADEDRILNRALGDAKRFVGNAAYEEYQKEYVNVYLQDIYYYPSNKLCDECFKYGSKGLIRSSYYNMLMKYKDGEPFIRNIITLMKRAKSIIDYDGKILLLVPLISIIQRVIKVMENDPFFSKYTFAAVDGSMPLAQRREAMESDFILSTSLSMGTGVDVSNLGVVVNFDQYSSSIIGEQIFGRLRDRGKETYYIDICDVVKQAKMLQKWGQKRRILIPYYPGAKRDMKRFPTIHS